MTGRRRNPCLLGHVTGLLLCLYLKIFLFSILPSIDIWSNLVCVLLDIGFADKNVKNFFNRKLQAYPFRPRKKYKPTKQEFWCTKNLHGSMWKSGCLDYTELTNILLRDVKGEYSAKGSEKKQKSWQFIGKLGWSWLAKISRACWH